MIDTYFKISDFCISDNPIPPQIADAIQKHHLMPLNFIQMQVPFEVRVSLKSGYRSYEWEIANKRNGTSQHTFGHRKNKILKGHKGASDLTCENFEINALKFLTALIDNTKYTRLALYYNWHDKLKRFTGFIHVDYRAAEGKQQIFTSTRNSEWTYIGDGNKLTAEDLEQMFKKLKSNKPK